MGDLRESSRLVQRGYGYARGKALRLVGGYVPRHVYPSLMLVGAQARRMDLEDADSLTGRQHAHNPIPGDSSALLEGDRDIALETTQGNSARLAQSLLQFRAGTEFQPGNLSEIEPAILLLRAWPALWTRGLRSGQIQVREDRLHHIIDCD